MSNPQVSQPSRLDRIEAILAEVAASQQRSQQQHDSEMVELRASQQASAERFRRIEVSQERTQATLDRIAIQQEENIRAIAVGRQQLEAGIADVVTMVTESQQMHDAEMLEISAKLKEASDIAASNARAIQAWEQRLEDERDQTVNVEVDTLNAIQDLQSGQDGLRNDVQTLSSFVRDGFNLLGQAMVDLRQELSGLRQELAAQIQNLIDITRDNTGRITRLEDGE